MVSGFCAEKDFGSRSFGERLLDVLLEEVFQLASGYSCLKIGCALAQVTTRVTPMVGRRCAAIAG
jgi:hypothetical protein